MKYLILILVFFLVVSMGYANFIDNQFNIETGKNQYQIGLKMIDYAYFGPRSIAEGNGNIYILDTVNFKVNIYSKSGTYVESYVIPKNLRYYDISTDRRGRIYLITDTNIYVISNNKSMKKLYQIPKNITSIYYFNVDDLGNFVIYGLSNTGLGIIGIINEKGEFNQLKGQKLFLSRNGLVGLHTSDDRFTLLKDGKEINSIKLSPKVFSIGITDDESVYYLKKPSVKGKIEIYRVNCNGNIVAKTVDYSFELISDPQRLQQLFRVTQKGEVVMIDLVDEKIKVSVVNF